MADWSYSERDYPAAPERAAQWAGIGIALVLHAAAIGALFSLAPIRTVLTDGAAPIVVRLIAPAEQAAQPKLARMAEPLPPKARLTQAKPTPRAPVNTPAPETPEPSLSPSAPIPSVEPARESLTVTPARGPATVGSQAAAPAAALTPPAPPPQLVLPSFNADYLANPAPAYPPLSRRAGEEGKVVLRVFVSEQGLPAQIELRASSGHPRLDEAALSTVKHWKFVPARRSDTPVGAWVLVPIAFSLRS